METNLDLEEICPPVAEPEQKRVPVISMESVDSFLSFLERNGRTKQTIATYRRCPEHLYALLPDDKEIGADTLRQWREAMRTATLWKIVQYRLLRFPEGCHSARFRNFPANRKHKFQYAFFPDSLSRNSKANAEKQYLPRSKSPYARVVIRSCSDIYPPTSPIPGGFFASVPTNAL